MNQAQDLVTMVFLNDGKISSEDAKNGLIVMVNNRKNSIGTSKALEP